MTTKPLYGAHWDARIPEVLIEIACIQNGGQWKDKRGNVCGLGLVQHYQNLQRQLWPDLDVHRWSELCLKEMVTHSICVLMGPKSCAKTHEAAKMALCEYWIDPEHTMVLMSSTDIRSLELRIWGECKMLFGMAKERFPFLAGHLVDSKHAITTDDIDESAVRDMRRGIIGVPCVEGGKVTNLKKYQGIKQKRLIICADEAAAMSSSFLSAFSNLDANPYYKAFIMGNPSTMQDPLGRAAEPKEGWEKYMSPEKTTCWDTRFLFGRCVNLIGTDSPNFDFPQDKKPRYPYLISKRTIDSTAAFFTKDSMEYHSQCIGDMQVSSLARQVITRLLCEQQHAFDMVTWGDAAPMKIYGIDAAYGGDRCVGGYIEWGKDITDKQILNMHEPVIIPIRVKSDQIPEDQIAEFVMLDCLRNSIPPENVFYDATGRGSLGTSFARIWSDKTNPIEFGAAATERPVCNDLFIYDPSKRAKRLMMCKERYDRFVTELWFSFRFIVESSQFRGLTEEVMEEFTMRYWDRPKEKYRLEKKEEMKDRVGRSPDIADWLVTCIEGSRRLGFVSTRLLNSKVQTIEDIAWDDLIYEQHQLQKRHQLNYAA